MRHLHSLLEDTVDIVAMHGTDTSAPALTPSMAAAMTSTMARTGIDPMIRPGGDEDGDVDPPVTMRFRADTVDQAIADATAEIGREIEVIEANRIRRGGVGGFFATDLGVEIVVAPVSSGPVRSTASSNGTMHERLGVPTTDMPAIYSAPPTTRRPRRRTSADADVDRRSASAPRPQFYDRVIEEAAEAQEPVPQPRSTTTSTTTSETCADPTVGSITRQINSESFASHFARQMALDPTELGCIEPEFIDPEPVGRHVTEPSMPDREPDAPHADSVGIAGPSGDDDGHRAEPTRRPRRVSTNVRRATRSSHPASDDPVPPNGPRPAAMNPAPSADPVPSADPALAAGVTAPVATTATPGDVLTGAVNTLVEQLAHTAPVEGSRLSDLKRLRLKVTTSGGDVIEMTAELGGK